MRRGIVAAVGLLVVVAVGGRLLGCKGPVDATECVTADSSAVCVDRRGSELELRAEGLLPGSRVLFEGDPIPVDTDGHIEARWFFEMNTDPFTGALTVEATAANGAKFGGELEFTS